MKPIKPLYVLILVIIVAAAGFYSGVMYQKSQRISFAGAQGMMYGNRGFGQVQQGQAGVPGGTGMMRPINGEIVSQDANSITVKLSDGSSKIVNLTGQTKINKATVGSVSDLKSGDHVTAIGTTNADGSVTAQMVSVGISSMMFRGPRNQASPAGSQQ